MFKVADIIEEAQIGGPQIRMISFAKELKDKVQTTLLIPKINNSYLIDFCKKNDLRVIELPINKISKNKLLILNYFIFFFYEIYLLVRLFKNEKFDLVHISGGSWQFKGIIAAKICNLPSVWHLNDTYMPWIIRAVFSFLGKWTTAFIFASNKTKDYYSRYIPNNIPSYVVPATVDTAKFNPNVKLSSELKEKEGCGKILVGTVANVSPVKGIENIINIVRYFKNESNIKFFILGNVPNTQVNYYNKINSLISKYELKNVQFLKFERDVRSFLKRINIYLCTSVSESSPISIWEAMSMQKAIISNDVGDVPLYINNNINGILVKNNRIQEYITALETLINDKEKIKNYGINARNTVKKYLETSICSNHQLEIFNRVIRK